MAAPLYIVQKDEVLLATSANPKRNVKSTVY